MKGIHHVTVGTDLDQSEWESTEGHEIANGTTLPISGESSGDLFFKTDTERLYIYVS